MASKALGIAMGLKKLINVERKFHDVDIADTPTSSGTVLNLSNIAQGDDSDDRTGNSIKAVSLTGRWSAEMHASATFTTFRMIIFRDNEQNGSDPTPANVLEQVSTRGNLNKDSYGRFTVLRDWYIGLHADARDAHVAKFYKELNHHIYYSGTTATDASNRKGALYVLMLSSEATNVPSIAGRIRLRYIDN